MDPIANPFAPGAGSPPPELVGRGPILDQADILLGRVRQQKAEGLTFERLTTMAVTRHLE
jgi:hypothetical protein